MEKIFENINSSKPLLQRGLGKVPAWLKNKYFLTGSFFIIWMVFFDLKDLASDFSRRARLKELQKNEKHLVKEISETNKELDLLKTNAQTIERYAREKYLMKKDNEDLFIVNAPPGSN
jgi:cell division protein DivIC